jgi:predicted phosphodiesterase
MKNNLGLLWCGIMEKNRHLKGWLGDYGINGGIKLTIYKGKCQNPKCGKLYKGKGEKYCSASCFLIHKNIIKEQKEMLEDKYIIPAINLQLIDRLSQAPALKHLSKLKTQDETVIIHLTDWHIGKLIVDVEGQELFNILIAKKRAELFCQKVLYLIKQHILEGTKLSKVVLFITGDMVDGEGIYEGQSNNLEIMPPKQVITCAEVLIKLFKELFKMKMPIEVYAVKGNHGRTGKDRNTSSNWDLMLYMILELWARENKVKDFYIKYSEADYLKIVINNWNYLLRHEGVATTETPSGASKAYGWQDLHGIDALVYGHLHHPSIGSLGHIRTFMGGSLTGVDDFAERIAKGCSASQLVWGITRKHLSTFIYIVDLK